ncbi:hypothetical protein H072_10189 [Dactylellina haptotyla CBS 200.50]|uniref:Uncharacterized protein n=1 Tax=Dactylellina haptotyla (strain CBS 200.50) TaxID=1284197 RepID=S8BAY8_DACHA|nr:hypothetical protein H072_10189 [Dactylellina haptotyla CBS 200.50]
MRSRISSAGFLLSLLASAYADPYPSAIDGSSGTADIQARSEGSGLSFLGAMRGLQKHDSIVSVFKRNLREMDEAMALLYPRQVATIPTDPKTGNTGTANFDLAAWDAEVIDACDDHMMLFGSLVNKKTDPAGVGVCYNIPFYNATSGDFASDIRLWKIADGTADWEAIGTKFSLSVVYQGATFKIASAAGNGTASISGNTANTSQAPANLNIAAKVVGNAIKKPVGGGAAANDMVGPPPKGDKASFAIKAASKTSSASKKSAKTSAKAASKTTSASAAKGSTAMIGKRMEMAQMQEAPAGADAVAFEIKLLQTMRFVGKVNPDVMKNATIAKNPAIMKLVLTPSILLVAKDASGKPMNASVAAAQIQFVTGAFSNITAPAAAAAPFVLPGTFIAIFPIGLYLFTAYMILFLLVVGWGTVERYLFRMSFRKRSAMSSGRDGQGKI